MYWSLVFLAWAFCAKAYAEDTSRCPPNLNRQYLRTFRNRCYYFAVYEERYWQDANLVCEHMGGQMVSIPDAQTQDFLVQALGSMGYDHNGIWIGLTDYVEEGNWKWVSGEPLAYTNWIPGQPGIAASLEDCALMERKQGYKWADYHCHIWPQHYSFICQFTLAPTLAPATAMPPQVHTTMGLPSSHPTTALHYSHSFPWSSTTSTGGTTMHSRTTDLNLHPTQGPVSTRETSPTRLLETTALTDMTSRNTEPVEVTSQGPSTSYPDFLVPQECGDFICSLHCGPAGFEEGRDGCPVCRCVTLPSTVSK